MPALSTGAPEKGVRVMGNARHGLGGNSGCVIRTALMLEWFTLAYSLCPLRHSVRACCPH